MPKEIKIKHGMPENNFFLIAQPKRDYDFLRFPQDGTYTIIELTDPKTDEKIKAELHTKWSLDEKQFMSASSFAELAYGVTSDVLKKALMKKYPELADKFKIEYWLLKKI
jgi:hypothetical protein